MVISSVMLLTGCTSTSKEKPSTQKTNVKSAEVTESSQQKLQSDLKNKSLCREVGQKFFETQKEKEVDQGYIYTVFETQEYTFNEEMNTCLVAWEDSTLYKMKDGYDVHIRHITNTLTDEDVYSWYQRTLAPYDKNSAKDISGSEIEYKQMLQRYGFN